MSSQSEKPPGDNLPIKQDNIEATSCQTMDGTTHLNNPGPSGSRRRSNPYCFPENVLCQDVTYNGVAVTQFTAAMDSIAQLKIIRSLLMRSDDVIIAAFPKCGTHWVSEMLNMLLSGTTDYVTRPKEFEMLELIEDATALDQLDSPRVLNSHLYIAHLPEQLVEKKVKLVHLIRHPKDCAVSLYHHWKQRASEKFTFDNFIKGYITEGYTDRSHQLDYLRQMAQFEDANPDHPIMHIHYEDLKRDPVSMLEALSQFVGIQTSRKFCEEVTSACSFDKMKQADKTRELPQHLNKVFSKGLKIYRKGVVGDWKNMFTVAQSEMFDQFLARQEEKGLPNNFRWQ
ncbi:hypothetical protein RRG08_038473 [Elysia crispata]|uniref:Sulfotransferase domain-containing protein n=1 Tax=Elysia crispata TaxID=231223 RepID=A0AAE0XRQ4_9GAST|nr:hypothetical protein RRG08_038473 [Elysia crispata]